MNSGESGLEQTLAPKKDPGAHLSGSVWVVRRTTVSGTKQDKSIREKAIYQPVQKYL